MIDDTNSYRYLPFWHVLQLARFPSHKYVYENVGFHNRTLSKASLRPKHVGPKEMDNVHVLLYM